MNFLFEDGFEKTFNHVKYYLQQAEWRNNKSYIEIAADYCNDALKSSEVPLAVKDKALYLRGICYLMLGKGEEHDIKEQCFLEAATMFLKLQAISLHETVDIEFNIDKSLFNEFFAWNRQRNRKSAAHTIM